MPRHARPGGARLVVGTEVVASGAAGVLIGGGVEIEPVVPRAVGPTAPPHGDQVGAQPDPRDRRTTALECLADQMRSGLDRSTSPPPDRGPAGGPAHRRPPGPPGPGTTWCARWWGGPVHRPVAVEDGCPWAAPSDSTTETPGRPRRVTDPPSGPLRRCRVMFAGTTRSASSSRGDPPTPACWSGPGPIPVTESCRQVRSGPSVGTTSSMAPPHRWPCSATDSSAITGSATPTSQIGPVVASTRARPPIGYRNE